MNKQTRVNVVRIDCRLLVSTVLLLARTCSGDRGRLHSNPSTNSRVKSGFQAGSSGQYGVGTLSHGSRTRNAVRAAG